MDEKSIKTFPTSPSYRFFLTSKYADFDVWNYNKISIAIALIYIEKKKRGNFTYKTLPQANKEPAEDSTKNANLFVSSIISFLEKN